MQDDLTTLSQNQLVTEGKASQARMEALLDLQDLQDLQSKHTELLSTEYLKSSTLRLNNQMYFKCLRKIDSKVRGYLDTAHGQALRYLSGDAKDLDSLAFVRPQEELKERLIQVHDVNVHLVFDNKVKKKFFKNAEFIQDCLLDEEEARMLYEREKDDRRSRGERFLEDIRTEGILQFAFIKSMALQQRELEDAERFRGLDPVLEQFRQERPIKI